VDLRLYSPMCLTGLNTENLTFLLCIILQFTLTVTIQHYEA